MPNIALDGMGAGYIGTYASKILLEPMFHSDDIMRNYTVAKITMDCDFNPTLNPLEKVKEEYIYTSNIEVTTSNIIVENSNNDTSNYDINISNVIVTSNLENCLDSNNELIYEIQYDENLNIIYEEDYEIKYITLEGLIIPKDEYNSNIDYKIAFVGCTYHCG